METAHILFTADGSGQRITFVVAGVSSGIIDDVILQKIEVEEHGNTPVIKDVFVGSTDEGQEIHFRADTHNIQLIGEFETFAVPLAIVTKSQRGSLIKCFVALGDEDFYELDGTATKGTSIVKIHKIEREAETNTKAVREVRISWRDSSKQLCRLTQGGIIFLPTTMSYTE